MLVIDTHDVWSRGENEEGPGRRERPRVEIVFDALFPTSQRAHIPAVYPSTSLDPLLYYMLVKGAPNSVDGAE